MCHGPRQEEGDGAELSGGGEGFEIADDNGEEHGVETADGTEGWKKDLRSSTQQS